MILWFVIDDGDENNKGGDDGVQDTEVIVREVVPGRPITWTGPGFMRIAEGSSIEFVIDEIPVSMDYDIIIRYETQVMIVIR